MADGLDAVGHGMSWGEAIRLAKILHADPSSAVGAALAGLEYTSTRGELLLADIWDLTAAAHTDPKDRPKPHPMRPYEVDDRDKRKRGDAAGRTPEQIKAILREHGHQIPV